MSEDLVVAISTDASAVGVGEFVDLAVVAENAGEQPLNDATLTFAPPRGTSFDIRSSDVGWRCDLACTIELGTIEAGGSADVGATIVVLEPDGRRSIDVASTLQGEAPGGTVAATGTAALSLATVDVGVTLEPVDEPVAGEVARFRVKIENLGSVAATEVELDLNLPEPLLLDTLSGSDAASCRPVSGRCRFLAIQPGTTEVIAASWSVPSSLPTEQVEVTARVMTPLADETPSDNAAALESTVDGIRVEAVAAPSGLFDNSDTSTWLGVAAGIVAAALIAWIISSGIRRRRPDDENELDELPVRDAT